MEFTSRHAIFRESSLNVAMFGTSREHIGNILREKIFWKVLEEKGVFVINLYDLIITNVDLLVKSSNYEVMFPEYSRNIPPIAVSKISQGYSRNIVKLWKTFQKSKNSKKNFLSNTVKILKLAVSSLAMFFWTLLNLLFIEFWTIYWITMFWKSSH